MSNETREKLNRVIVVWVTRVSLNENVLPDLEPLLDARERERADRFRFAEDRARFVLGRALVRNLLGRCLDRPAKAIELTLADLNRPVFDVDETIQFSITHTHDLVAVAATCNARVGIDLEFIQSTVDLVELAERILSEEDLATFEAFSPEEKLAAFFRVWTRKESYLKARGEGIAEGLRLVSVSFGPEVESSLADARDERAAVSWKQHLLPAPNDYTGSVACDDSSRRVEFQPVKFENAEPVFVEML